MESDMAGRIPGERGGRSSLKSWLQEGSGFIVVGSLQFVIDWAMFVALTYFGAPTVPANIFGRVTGASLGFWLNGRYTFAARGARLGLIPLLRFFVTWCLMTLLSTLLVNAADGALGLQLAWLAKPVVEVLLAAIGFVISRYWIYK